MFPCQRGSLAGVWLIPCGDWLITRLESWSNRGVIWSRIYGAITHPLRLRFRVSGGLSNRSRSARRRELLLLNTIDPWRGLFWILPANFRAVLLYFAAPYLLWSSCCEFVILPAALLVGDATPITYLLLRGSHV
jgi:hypothetical protein